ncbi:carboxyl transferase domain-containing protein, partial [Jimgerdemannia flammicorona]
MVTNFTPANFVAGSANLNGRPVIVGADDFSVRGGHADGAIANKALYTEQLALSFRIPMVRLIDGSSGGGSVTTLLEWGMYVLFLSPFGPLVRSLLNPRRLHSKGRTYIPPLIGMDTMIASLSEIPVVAAVLGPAVGLGAARAVLTHFSVIARSTGQLFAAGPPIVEHATFESVTKDELGGAEIQTANGSIDNLAPDEKTCFEQLRRFLSYLPSSTSRLPPAAAVWHAPNPPKALHLLIPHRRQRAFNVRTVVEGVVDQKSWFEIGEGWGDGVVVGLATLEGWPVGVLAGDCEKVGGVLTERGTAKL